MKEGGAEGRKVKDFPRDMHARELTRRSSVFLVICLSVGLFPPLADSILSFQGNIQLDEIFRIDSSSSGQQFRSLCSVACDRSRDDILISDTDANRVYIFDRRGKVSGILGRNGELRRPTGVAVDIRGTVYVGEKESGLIKVFEGEERRVSELRPALSTPILEGEKKASPRKMAIDRDGRLLSVDGVNGWIVVFNEEGAFKYRIGLQGKDENAFSFLSDIACDTRGLTYAASRGLDPLNVFDRSGKLLYALRDPRMEVEDVIDPIAIALDGRNRLWVLDGVSGDIRVYDSSGNHIQTIDERDTGGGLFLPVDMELDASNNLYILEKGAGRLRVYSVRY